MSWMRWVSCKIIWWQWYNIISIHVVIAFYDGRLSLWIPRPVLRAKPLTAPLYSYLATHRLVINNGFHQSACIFPLGFLNIDHSTHLTLLSSCQLSSETSSIHFLSIDILSGQEWFLCGIQKMPQWSLMSVFEANQKSLSPHMFMIFLPSSVLSQALVRIFAEYLNTSS